MRPAIRVLGAAALLALAACAGLTPRTGRGPVEFELSGRIAVRYANDASSGNIAWRHAAGDDDVRAPAANALRGQPTERVCHGRVGRDSTIRTAHGAVAHNLVG